MTHRWFFRTTRRGDDIADPISGEFFADGSLESIGTALVREAIQNALDAGRAVDRSGGPVTVHFGLFRNRHAASAETAAEWFGALRDHLRAPGNGLKDVPAEHSTCDYLTVEDFGTSGLTGDIDSDSVDGEQNNFVDFLRSDGRTRKAGGDRGSWGVGKNVFPRSSRINGFLAHTIRHNDHRRLLTGKCILKIRRLGAEQFQPPCYLATSWSPDDVPRPHEDDALIGRFKRAFNIVRASEPGLSLVIPWLDQDITLGDLVDATISQYFLAILSGTLAVRLTDGSQDVTLSAGNITEQTRHLAPEHSPLVELAEWALDEGSSRRLVLLCPAQDQPQQWSPSMVPATVSDEINGQMLEHGRASIRVPLHVCDRGARRSTPTFFDIFIEYDDSQRQLRPAFFREQLSISGVKRALGAPKVRALVMVDDKPLADLLRAAEPPNHTDWDPKTANFRKEFKDGNHVITFVKTAVTRLMSFVRSDEDRPNTSVAVDFFSIPAANDRSPGEKKPDRRQGPNTEEPRTFPPVSKRRFRIKPLDDGFAIGPGDPDATPPARLRVQFAYDVMNGSPWKQFERADFDLTRPDQSGLQLALEGAAEIRVTGPNRLEIRIGSREFGLVVHGFDTNRDLIVRAYDPKEPVSADPETELHEEA